MSYYALHLALIIRSSGIRKGCKRITTSPLDSLLISAVNGYNLQVFYQKYTSSKLESILLLSGFFRQLLNSSNKKPWKLTIDPGGTLYWKPRKQSVLHSGNEDVPDISKQIIPTRSLFSLPFLTYSLSYPLLLPDCSLFLPTPSLPSTESRGALFQQLIRPSSGSPRLLPPPSCSFFSPRPRYNVRDLARFLHSPTTDVARLSDTRTHMPWQMCIWLFSSPNTACDTVSDVCRTSAGAYSALSSSALRLR